MARRKYEFRPDKVKTDFLGKLYLTPQQRKQLLRWLLFAVLLVVASVLQDVVLCRMQIFGATTDLVPLVIILICVQIGADRGAIFALIAAMLYKFSGTAPGYYSMALIPVLALLAAMLRQSYFRRSFGSVFLCVTAAIVLYEMTVLLCGLIFQNTTSQRALRFLFTGLISAATLPILYPITKAIDNIGEKSWTD
jgi:rod shape-determining protein MreD